MENSQNIDPNHQENAAKALAITTDLNQLHINNATLGYAQVPAPTLSVQSRAFTDPAAAAIEAAAAATAAKNAHKPLGDLNKPQICFDFTKNQCSRGNSCKFSHNVDLIIQVNSQEKGICFDFLKGLCNRGALCRFSHDIGNIKLPPPSQRTPLPSSFPSSAPDQRRPPTAPICYDFVKNQCNRGDDCKYSHDYSSILYGSHQEKKNPFIICVDFTRGRCARGSKCRYSHLVTPQALQLARHQQQYQSAINAHALAAAYSINTMHDAASNIITTSTTNNNMGIDIGYQNMPFDSNNNTMYNTSSPALPPPIMNNNTNKADAIWPGSIPTQNLDAATYIALLNELQRARMHNTIATPSPLPGPDHQINALPALSQCMDARHMHTNTTYSAQHALRDHMQQLQNNQRHAVPHHQQQLHMNDHKAQNSVQQQVQWIHPVLSKVRATDSAGLHGGVHNGTDSPTIRASWGGAGAGADAASASDASINDASFNDAFTVLADQQQNSGSFPSNSVPLLSPYSHMEQLVTSIWSTQN